MGVKDFLKKIFIKIYQIGYDNHIRSNQIYFENIWRENSLIEWEKVKIELSAIIINGQKDKVKIVIGNGSWIRGQLLTFSHGGKIEIGEDCFIGEQTKIWSSKSIKIGKRVLISHNVNIMDNNSHPMDSLKRFTDFKNPNENEGHVGLLINEKEIVIEDDVWIGYNASIFKGVKIGRGAIIGACSIITKDVEPFSIVVGKNEFLKRTT